MTLVHIRHPVGCLRRHRLLHVLVEVDADRNRLDERIPSRVLDGDVRRDLCELPRVAIRLGRNLVGRARAAERVECILRQRVELNSDLRDVAVDDDHLPYAK